MPEGDPKKERVMMLSLVRGTERDTILARGDIIVVYTKDKDELDLITLVQTLESIGFTVTKERR